MASDVTQFLVTWVDARNGDYNYVIYAARLTSEGTNRDPSGNLLWNATDSLITPRVARGGTNYLVVFTGMRVARVSAAEELLCGLMLTDNGGANWDVDSNGNG